MDGIFPGVVSEVMTSYSYALQICILNKLHGKSLKALPNWAAMRRNHSSNSPLCFGPLINSEIIAPIEERRLN
mgnify:CR=1 FL=1